MRLTELVQHFGQRPRLNNLLYNPQQNHGDYNKTRRGRPR